MNRITEKDIEKQLKELNARTKQVYTIGHAYSGLKLEDEQGSSEFSHRLTKPEMYYVLYTMNKVLSNEEYATKKEVEA